MAIKTLFDLVKHSLAIDEDIIKKLKRDLDSLFSEIKDGNINLSKVYLNKIEARIDLLNDDLQSFGVMIEAIEKESEAKNV
jgi:septation ring formation regulator EzrA